MYQYLLLFFLCGSISGSVYGQKPLSPAAFAVFKKEVATHTTALQTLESSFVQTRHLDFMDNELVSSGKMYFKAPGLIRWEYTAPFRYIVVFRGDSMYVNDNGHRKETALSSGKRMKELSGLLTGTIQGTHIFDTARFRITCYQNGSGYACTFLPVDKTIARYIQEVKMVFDGKDFLVSSIRITDPAADYTDIVFDRQKKNVPVADEKFAAP